MITQARVEVTDQPTLLASAIGALEVTLRANWSTVKVGSKEVTLDNGFSLPNKIATKFNLRFGDDLYGICSGSPVIVEVLTITQG